MGDASKICKQAKQLAELEENMMGKYREIYERKLKSMDEILHQISCMDQAEDEEQLAEVIPHILKAMGEYTNADRVYIFDWTSDAHTNMNNTFEWCADGVEAEIQNLQDISILYTKVDGDIFSQEKYPAGQKKN